MEKITLNLWDAERRPIVRKSFKGELLVGDEDDGLRANDDTRRWDAGAEWSVFATARGKLAVYQTHCNDRFAPQMHVYDDFESMKAASVEAAIPVNVLAATAQALGVEYEIELDI